MAGLKAFFEPFLGWLWKAKSKTDEPPPLTTDEVLREEACSIHGVDLSDVDCDDLYPNWKTEVVNNCRPFYLANDFLRTPTTNPAGPCPWPVGSTANWNNFLNPPAPYDAEWQPYTCLRSDVPPGPGQVRDGLNERLFPGQNGRIQCPRDSAGFVPGRNYWDDDNNPLSGGTYAFADLLNHSLHRVVVGEKEGTHDLVRDHFEQVIREPDRVVVTSGEERDPDRLDPVPFLGLVALSARR